MKTITDSELLEKLQQKDDAAYSLLYKFYFPSIRTFVTQNSGIVQDAEDVFQESILVLFQKVADPSFKLTSSLKTYLFAISRNLWLKRLRDAKSFTTENLDQHLLIEHHMLEEQSENLDEEKVKGWMDNITENCRRILQAIFFYLEPMESLMMKMGWKNKHTADNQKYKCVQQVKREAERSK